MSNFKIHFSNPLLLLLLIPAIGFTLISYFRLSKKYRKNRNRITSIVLHLLVMLFSISVLAGIEFLYQIPNDVNEIILLVDVSQTQEQAKINRDEFVETVLEDGKYANYKIGVVTFGFDQNYAVPLTYDVDEIYEKYLVAELPDTSATDVAAALRYTKELFDNPETGKIVLITDGKVTDESEATDTAIRSAALQGITVDTVYISSSYEGNNLQLIGVELPDYHIGIREECTIGLTLRSNNATTGKVTLFDNGYTDPDTGTQLVELANDTQTIFFQHTFETEGLHKLLFEVESEDDSLKQNNQYYSYLYLEEYNKILLLERTEGESKAFEEMLNEDEAYVIEVKNIQDEDVPTTVEELCMYDQVVLNNIAHKDMPIGFDVLLESYVSNYGGGLFTIGGNDETGAANMYDRTDMFGTVYQQILPVEAITYTPPIGVIVIIDRSGSMGGSNDEGYNKLDWAKAGAGACLDSLSERDYIGIMTLDESEAMILPLTERTQEAKILAAIDSIKTAEGATKFAGAIDAAGLELRNLKNVAKRHIIIVTDGQVPGDEKEKSIELATSFYQTDGTTLSIVGVDMEPGSSAAKAMGEIVAVANGRLHAVSSSELIRSIKDDLNVPEIKAVNTEPFNPIVNNKSALLDGVEFNEENKLNVQLNGFYGVKAKTQATKILIGEYDVPIYAQWKYGEGTVGSFMCDLNGVWSADFMADASGKTFIRNVVDNLMPVNNIRPKSMNIQLVEDNYINQLSVYTSLAEGEYITGQIVDTLTGTVASLNETVNDSASAALDGVTCYATLGLSVNNNYSRCSFVVKKSGVYQIVLTKYDADGNVLSVFECYKNFSYSKEYDTFAEESESELEAKLAYWAERGNGVKIAELENPSEIFENFVTAIDKSFDPSFPFMIMAIILFLLDIAVRKFKFKWPHELIREYKEKKSSE